MIIEKLSDEMLSFWHRFEAATVDEQAFFYQRVKPLLTQIMELMSVNGARIEQLERDLNATRSRVQEYETRWRSATITADAMERDRRSAQDQLEQLRAAVTTVCAALAAAVREK